MMVSLTIDGQQVFADEGTTILQAAQQKGIEIPTLCFHPRMRPLGFCRLCLVEVEGINKPVTSCNTPVVEGMKVTTNSEALVEQRKEILSMLLETHPTEECLVCEKSGSCELQEQAYQMGCLVKRSYILTDEVAAADDNPHIIRDPDKCIMCGRCIRVCSEVVQRFVYELKGGGLESRVVAGSEEKPSTLEDAGCVFCGNCVEVCPVGALTEKERSSLGREWDLQPVKGVCNHCAVGCNVVFQVKDGQVVKINADPEEDPFGWLCIKGKFGYDYLKGEERLTTPLIREGEKGSGDFREATWEEALDYAAKGLSAIKEKDPGALAVLSSGRCTNEENYLLQKFARGVLGTNHLEIGLHLGFGHAAQAMEETLGITGSTTTLEGIRKAETIMVFGSDTLKDQPVAGMRVKEAVRYQGARLVNISTQENYFDEAAHLNLRIKPGSDLSLIKGLLNWMVQEGLYDSAFVEKYTEGLDEIKQDLQEFTPEKVQKETGVSPEDLAKAARWLGDSKNALALVGRGLVKERARENTLALINLLLAGGHLGREGNGLILLYPKSNIQGSLDMGGTAPLLPGYRKVSREEDRKELSAKWGLQIPEKEGKELEGIMAGARSGEIKGLYLVGDTLESADRKERDQALAALDCLVVQELFLTPGARYADVIFPGASFAETEGTFTNLERRVQKDNSAVPAHEGCWTDREITQALADKLGISLQHQSEPEIMEEIAEVVPQYGGISWERLEEEGGLSNPCPEEGHHGTANLSLEGKKVKFTQV